MLTRRGADKAANGFGKRGHSDETGLNETAAELQNVNNQIGQKQLLKKLKTETKIKMQALKTAPIKKQSHRHIINEDNISTNNFNKCNVNARQY